MEKGREGNEKHTTCCENELFLGEKSERKRQEREIQEDRPYTPKINFF